MLSLSPLTHRLSLAHTLLMVRCRPQSVIDLPLLERHKLLDRLVAAAPAEGYALGPSTVIKGRVLKLLPGQPLPEGMPGSRHSAELKDIQEVFEEVLRVKVLPAGSVPSWAHLQTPSCRNLFNSLMCFLQNHLHPVQHCLHDCTHGSAQRSAQTPRQTVPEKRRMCTQGVLQASTCY